MTEQAYGVLFVNRIPQDTSVAGWRVELIHKFNYLERTAPTTGLGCCCSFGGLGGSSGGCLYYRCSLNGQGWLDIDHHRPSNRVASRITWRVDRPQRGEMPLDRLLDVLDHHVARLEQQETAKGRETVVRGVVRPAGGRGAAFPTRR